MERLDGERPIGEFTVSPRRLNGATAQEIVAGATSDVYFARGLDILRRLGRERTVVTAEVFSRQPGVLCGVDEVVELLRQAGAKVQVEALAEGAQFAAKEPLMRLSGPYSEFAVYETAILGMLASASAWATAARAFREAVPADRPVIGFGARHLHPAVVGVFDRATRVGGLDGVSSILGARLSGVQPIGTMPHAALLIAGDTLSVAQVLTTTAPKGARTVLVDTFHDEVEETLAIVRSLGDQVDGVRLDTPAERGGVQPDLVRELKARLAQEGFSAVSVMVSGGLSPERAVELAAAGADAFGVGHAISKAAPLDMTLDLKVVDGKPVAKRGRIPGLTATVRLRPQSLGATDQQQP
ncbi:MAG: nicotinate phosphoribosyltransferase [Sulfobacillus sp.]